MATTHASNCWLFMCLSCHTSPRLPFELPAFCPSRSSSGSHVSVININFLNTGHGEVVLWRPSHFKIPSGKEGKFYFLKLQECLKLLPQAQSWYQLLWRKLLSYLFCGSSCFPPIHKKGIWVSSWIDGWEYGFMEIWMIQYWKEGQHNSVLLKHM